jgi:hypothetical protein
MVVEKKSSTGRTTLLITAVVTCLATIIGTQLFHNWYMRPIIVVDIKEFELPKVYTETIQEQLSKIPRINIIEIVNTGRSKGEILSLDFKTNNNVRLQGVSAETRSSVFKYITEEAKDGSSVIRVDMEYIRPNEKVIIKALTDVKANFFINQKLMSNGEILTREGYEKTGEVHLTGIPAAVLGICLLVSLFHSLVSIINYLKDKYKKSKLTKKEVQTNDSCPGMSDSHIHNP